MDLRGQNHIKRRCSMPRIYINDWPPFSPPDQSRRNNVIEAAKLIVNASMTAPLMRNLRSISPISTSMRQLW